jgi:hypothetical protein
MWFDKIRNVFGGRKIYGDQSYNNLPLEYNNIKRHCKNCGKELFGLEDSLYVNGKSYHLAIDDYCDISCQKKHYNKILDYNFGPNPNYSEIK